MLQHQEEPVPLDYRDFVNFTYYPDDINECIAEFAAKVAEAFQQDTKDVLESEDTFCSH